MTLTKRQKKKILFLFCILLCYIVIVSVNKMTLYFHKENLPIETITVIRTISYPSLGKVDKRDEILLNNENEINKMISLLKSYYFYKNISFEKITGISQVVQDIVQFRIFINYNINEKESHYDMIDIFCTRDMKINNVQIYCYNISSYKKYVGKMSSKIVEQFFEDIQVYFTTL